MIIALCDEDEGFIQKMQKKISEYASGHGVEAEFLHFRDVESLLSHTINSPDAVFLDISMEQQRYTGLGRMIHRKWQECQIIYCMDSVKFVLDIHETDYTAFLLKPQLETRFEGVMRKMEHLSDIKHKEAVYRLVTGREQSFYIKDILYFERKTRHTELVTADGIFKIRDKVTEVADRLPEGMFTRCHAAFTVNLDYVTGRKNASYLLSNGKTVPIGRSFLKTTLEEYQNWNEKMN